MEALRESEYTGEMMRKKYQSPFVLTVGVLLCGGLLGILFGCVKAKSPVTGLKSPDIENSQHNGGHGSIIYLPLAINGTGETIAGSNTWPMAGANPERTSWTSTEVTGKLDIAWFKPFDAYILPNVQIVAAYNLLYLSTANGLYAIQPSNGTVVWVYPTEMPLGNSPTLYQGVAYVGGYDRKIHAINALTGVGLWTFEAGAGFDTNPLVVNGILYAGNRDGHFYAIRATGPTAGQLIWQYDTGAPIHYSAAYKDGIVFFASNTSRVYALNAQTGSLVWQTGVLPGAGFYSWWPVIYGEYVIVAGSQNYRFSSDLGPGSLITTERSELYPNYATDPRGTLIGPIGTAAGLWAPGTPTIDTSKPTTTSHGQTQPITQYLESKPWRRTYFIFNRFTGAEYTSDFDNDGNPEYAPFLWVGTQGAGNRYPPVVGGDGVLYQANNYMSDPSIAGGHLTGWVPGSKYVSIVSSDWGAVDEPYAYSSGGNVVYWNLCCDRQLGAINVSLPNTNFYDRYTSGILPPTGAFDGKREWLYFNYDLEDRIPGYDVKYYVGASEIHPVFGSQNGIYGDHGYQNPPIPYNGMVFVHRSNAVIAFKAQATPVALPVEPIVSAPDQTTPVPVTEVVDKLETEVQKIVDAGHLLPGYMSSGIFDLRARFDCGDALVDYWHSPADLQITLLRALPYLSSGLQAEVRDYLQTEFGAFPPYTYNHIGWQTGTPRDVFQFPPEVNAARANYPPQTANNNFEGWDFSPYAFYSLWKYTDEFGGAQSILNSSQNLVGILNTPPPATVLSEMPFVINAYIAGFNGYLGLLQEANQPPAANIQALLNNFLSLRATTFTKDASPTFFTDQTKFYCRSLNVSRNFMYMTPELATSLRTSALSKVQGAVNEYETIAPYWFVSQLSVTYGEGVIHPYYDYNTLFQAKALILQEPYNTLTNYLDVPATAIGDLAYIQNLVTLIELGQ